MEIIQGFVFKTESPQTQRSEDHHQSRHGKATKQTCGCNSIHTLTAPPPTKTKRVLYDLSICCIDQIRQLSSGCPQATTIWTTNSGSLPSLEVTEMVVYQNSAPVKLEVVKYDRTSAAGMPLGHCTTTSGLSSRTLGLVGDSSSMEVSQFQQPGCPVDIWQPLCRELEFWSDFEWLTSMTITWTKILWITVHDFDRWEAIKQSWTQNIQIIMS